jgi:hypothetical protein
MNTHDSDEPIPEKLRSIYNEFIRTLEESGLNVNMIAVTITGVPIPELKRQSLDGPLVYKGKGKTHVKACLIVHPLKDTKDQ